MGCGDAAAIELALFWLGAFGIVVDENFAVDFRGVHGGTAFEQEIGFGRRAFEQKVEFLSNQFFLCARLIFFWVDISDLRRLSISRGESFFSWS